MRQKCNIDIRDKANESGIFLWQIADKLGMRDNVFSCKLRKELPQVEKERIFGIIEQLEKETE